MAVKQFYYNIPAYDEDKEQTVFKSSDSTDIYSSSGLKEYFLGEANKDKGITISHLGVQAPPGTKFVLNDTTEIIVGRTGVYEIDFDSENTGITNIYFERPILYDYSEEDSNKYMSKGIEAVETALSGYLETYNMDTEVNADTIETINNDTTDLQEKVQNGYYTWKQGNMGIYIKDDEDENKPDLKNVIIDCVYSIDGGTSS